MRRVLAVLGTLATVFGLLAIADRTLAQSFDLNYLFVTLVGALSLVQGIRVALSRRASPYRAASTGDPERRYEVPVPGDDVERDVRRVSGWGRTRLRRHVTLRDRLREAAVDALVAHGGHTPERARARIDAGDWPDDPVAVGFLTGERPDLPLRKRVRGLFRGESEFEYGARRAIDAIAAVREDES